MHPNPGEWKEIGDFIRRSRQRMQPISNVGAHGRSRPIAHPTQSEVAELAGVSTVLISKLEQGQYENLNKGLLEKLSIALELSLDEQQFLTGLLNLPTGQDPPEEALPDWIRTSIQHVDHPVAIVNPCMDILAWNQKLVGFMGDLSMIESRDRNIILLSFGDPNTRSQFADWEENTRVIISSLKMIYSFFPAYRQQIRELVQRAAELDTASYHRWVASVPKLTTNVRKHVMHPVHGDMVVNELISQIVGTQIHFRVEFIPADESTRTKMARF